MELQLYNSFTTVTTAYVLKTTACAEIVDNFRALSLNEATVYLVTQ